MEHTLTRIEAVNPAINAFVALRAEGAMAEARGAAEAIAAGIPTGPLTGVPIGIKDLEHVAGMTTSFGSALFQSNLAKRDSVHVKRLKAAGGIVVGKTNTPEFGYTFTTKNRLFGVTRNPWDTGRTPGGSSGGAAAAVVAQMVPLATGSDAGGSIRTPAAFTGCFGLKPSHGRIPLPTFPGPLDLLRMHPIPVLGPLSGSVRDAALFLDCAAGYHPCDPLSLPKPDKSFVQALEAPPKKCRIAFSPDLGYARVARSVLERVEQAAGAFQEMGHQVEVWTGRIPDVSEAWVSLLNCDFYAQIKGVYEKNKTAFNRGLVPVLEAAKGFGVDRQIEAQTVLTELNRVLWELFDRYDLLITPAMPIPAFDAKGQPPSEIDGHPIPLLGIVAFTCPFNFSGHPAASLPAGTTPDGLPVGMQVVAARHREDLLLQVCQGSSSRPVPGSPTGRGCRRQILRRGFIPKEMQPASPQPPHPQRSRQPRLPRRIPGSPAHRRS